MRFRILEKQIQIHVEYFPFTLELLLYSGSFRSTQLMGKQLREPLLLIAAIISVNKKTKNILF